MPLARRIEIVEARVAELVELGASIGRRYREVDQDRPTCSVVMHDPEGNEFCVA